MTDYKEEKKGGYIIACSCDHPFPKTDEIHSSRQFSRAGLSSCYMGKRKAHSARTLLLG